MKNIELAKYYGVSPAASSKWPAERKRRAIIEAEAGVSPEVKRLIGELAGLCYAAQVMTHTYIYVEPSFTGFDIWREGDRIVNNAPLNALALQGAIAKLEELIYG